MKAVDTMKTVIAFGLLLFFFGCKQKNTEKVQAFLLSDSVSVVTTPEEIDSRFTFRVVGSDNKSVIIALSPGEYDFSSYQTLVADITKGLSSPQQKAEAIWKFVSEWVYHCIPSARKTRGYDPFVMLNSFECGVCGGINATLSNLFTLAELESRVYSLGGHVVAEVFFDRGWHMYDADMNVFVLDDRNNVASVDYISKHPEVFDNPAYRLRNYGELPFAKQAIKKAYKTIGNNQVSAIYKNIGYAYLNEMEIQPNDVWEFDISRNQYTDYTVNFLKYQSTHPFSRNGKLTRQLRTDGVVSNEKVHSVTSPYAFDKVTLTSKGSNNNGMKVYYSVDSVNWCYQGKLCGNSQVSFGSFGLKDDPVTFKYFLKFVSVENLSDTNVLMESSFLFSDKIFLNKKNAVKVFNKGRGKVTINIVTED